MDRIALKDITVPDRFRKDYGDIDLLSDSIKEYGIIQPIVLARINGNVELVVGGRRLSALTRLGFKELEHAKEFIWREELSQLDGMEARYRLRSIELEENLRRKEMNWSEQVTAKAELLRLMQSIHGVASTGGRTREEIRTGVSQGFGVRKLAAMLGESPAITSKDLQIATAISVLPRLAQAPTKESAFRQASILITVHQMQQVAKAAPQSEKNWTLYEGNFTDNIANLADETVDLVYTDLPFGVDLDKMSKHASGVVDYSDTRTDILKDLTSFSKNAFRVLRPNRYCVVFFGFNFYNELITELLGAGFTVNHVPFVWYKHTNSIENPNTRYGNAYDPALVAMKGSPIFIRPGHQNVIDLAPVTAGTKLQIAQQPVELVERFILDMVAPFSTICDFCAGSGTTGVAALKQKCKVILFERDKLACEVIKARLGALKI